MLQKLVIGALVLTVIGAAGIGIYDAARGPQTAPITAPLETPADTQAQAAATPTEAPSAQPVALEATMQASPVPGRQGAGTPVQEQQVAAADMVGEAWAARGTIASLDDTGFTLRTEDGAEVYVELGQPAFWQAQGVPLAAGDAVSVQGFNNDGMIHAAIVTTASGAQLAVRSESGQPLWAGGAQGGQGAQADAHAAGTTGAETQIPADAWITLEGVVTAVQGSALTVQAADGQLHDFQLGQARFWQAQGVTFAAGDPVEVLGFWQGAAFQPGEIRKTATGERLMLRDPNGRPLWAGPGRTAEGVTGGAGQGNTGQGAAGQQAGGNGNAAGNAGGNGGGNAAAAGRGQGNGLQQQAFALPADQWETLQGNVIAVEPLAITIQTTAGEQVGVALGEVDFWTAQGYTFVVPEAVTIDGFWLNNQFEAGIVTFGDGTGTLYFRDEAGSLLWSETSQNGQGQGSNGRQYRGGRS